MEIDGFSRLVTFGKFSTNNRATTVLQLFREAVVRYGHPVRIRTDYGGENVEIWRYMVETHGDDLRPVIVGSPVHNQRIERHNRSVNEQLISTFYSLERDGLLDPSNCTDLFCLHYVFLPRLNKSLNQFIAAHNNHAISTEENKSPLRIFLPESTSNYFALRTSRVSLCKDMMYLGFWNHLMVSHMSK